MTTAINREAVKNQIKALEKQLLEDTKNKQTEAIKQVKAIIADFGLTASQCGFTTKRTPKDPNAPVKPKAEPKYVKKDKDGKEVKWSGKGRPPEIFKGMTQAQLNQHLIKN